MDHPRAGAHYPSSVGEFQAWFRTDADCLDYLGDSVANDTRKEIVSLLELMERFDPAYLMFLLTVVEHAGGLHMGETLLREQSAAIARVAKKRREQPPLNVDPDGTRKAAALEWRDKADRAEWFGALAYLAQQHGMIMTARAAEEVAQTEEPDIDAPRVFANLRDRIRDELDEMVLLWLDSRKRAFFEAEHGFGQSVSDRFPSAISDIDAAGKAIAVGLYPAAVFHLMRVMEHILRELVRVMKCPDPVGADRNWDKMINNVQAAVDGRKWAKGQKQFFDGAGGLLRGVKNAWRDPTMHVDARYAEDDALRVYHAVSGFAAHLANMPRELPDPPQSV